MTWDQPRTDRLAQLHAEGHTSSQIARDLGGVTRNGVIGKLHRMGLSVPRPPPVPKHQRPRRHRVRVRKQATYHPPKPVAGPFLGIPLLELEPYHCRYPKGGDNGEPFLFCGQPKQEGSSYCGRCHRIIYTRRDAA